MTDEEIVDVAHILTPVVNSHTIDPLVRVAAHDVMLSEAKVTCSSLCRVMDGYYKGGIALLEEALPACRCEAGTRASTRR